MYRLLFAEDERETREGILEMTDFSSLGISEVRSAKNGMEALEIAHSFLPDILLTDIRMPRMNGIQLSEQIRKLNPHCSILMISGYSDRSYLLSAIALKAVDFVDKPLRLSVLEQQLANAVAEQNSLRQKISYQKREFAALLCQPTADPTLAGRHLAELYPALSRPECQCILVTHRPKSMQPASLPYNTDTLLYGIIQKCELMLSRQALPYALHLYRPETVAIFLFQEHREGSLTGFPAIAEEFHQLLSEQDECLHAISGLCMPASQAYASLESALKLTELLFYSKGCSLLAAADTSPDIADSSGEIPAALLEAFNTQIAENHMDASVNILHKITDYYYGHPVLPVSKCVSLYSRLLFLLLKRQIAADGSIDHESIGTRLAECRYLSEIDVFLTKYIRNIMCPEKADKDTTDPLIRQILSIIHSQYQNPVLSLDEICRQTFLSASYVCVRFKKATGNTLVNYITEYRIRASLPLLADPARKLDDIANSVGIDSGNYYSKLFKKYMGMPPNLYRQSLKP